MASCGFVDYCKSAGLRQYEVARLLGVSKVTVCRWAKGKSVPQRRFVSRMSEVFGQTFSFHWAWFRLVLFAFLLFYAW